MKILYVIAVLLIVAGLVCSLGVIGRVEHEDRLLKAGELSDVEVTSTAELLRQLGVAISLVVLGGVLILVRKLLPANLFKYSADADLAFDTILGDRDCVELSEDEFVGDFVINETPYSLYRVAEDTYVITDASDNAIQYWKGTRIELTELEAKYDQ